LKADLHIHSVFSDGSDSISQIIDTAKKKRLDVISVTDHDTTEHWHRIPEESEIKIIPGVEISAIHYKTKLKAHILGYNIKETDQLNVFLQNTLIARSKNSEKQIEILIRNGFRIDTEKLAKAAGNIIYKQHIMQWLISTGQAEDMFGSFYQKTFKNGGICDFDISYPDIFDIIIAVKQAGGIAVLAHPGQQQNFNLIQELTGCGLDGLEINHPANTENDKTIIRDHAKKFNLFLTGGSDYHGKYENKSAAIGDFLSEESGVYAICKNQ